MAKVTSADVTAWLVQETPEHMKLMTSVRKRLAETMTTDVNDHGTPSRDWCRTYGRYAATYTVLLNEDRERLKLRLLMKSDDLSDEQYEAELRSLAVDSLGTLPMDALQKELTRRAQMALAEDPRALDGETDGDD